MAYVPEWERLSVALTRVMAAGIPEDEAKTDICNAIADRKIRVRFLVAKAEGFLAMGAAGKVHHGEEVDIPSPLTPGDFNWGLSRPLKPWQQIGGWLHDLWDWWHFEWLDLLRADVSKVLIATESHEAISTPNDRSEQSQGRRDKSRLEKERAQSAIKTPKRGRPPEYNWEGVKRSLESYAAKHGPVRTPIELLQKCSDFASELHLDKENKKVPDDKTIRDAIKKHGLDIAAGFDPGK